MELHNNTTLLVIDVQKGLFTQKTTVYKEKDILKNITELIDVARSNEIPIIFVQHNNKGLLKIESAGWKLHPSIHPLPDEDIVQKSNGSAFKETNLKDSLDEKDIKNIIMLGMTTHGCVKTTCNDALKLGYKVILVSDAHSSYSNNAEELIIKWNKILSEKGAVLRNTSEIIAEF